MPNSCPRLQLFEFFWIKVSPGRPSTEILLEDTFHLEILLKIFILFFCQSRQSRDPETVRVYRLNRQSLRRLPDGASLTLDPTLRDSLAAIERRSSSLLSSQKLESRLFNAKRFSRTSRAACAVFSALSNRRGLSNYSGRHNIIPRL